MHREDALDANAARDFAHRERLAHTSALAADADALEDLDALLVTFTDADVDAQRIAWRKTRQVRTLLFLGHFTHDIHVASRFTSALIPFTRFRFRSRSRKRFENESLLET